MRATLAGPWFAAALALALPVGAGPVLEVSIDGSVQHSLPAPEGQDICLHWAHSVTGGKVADCFENRAGQLLLTRSYLHDFAAGLGEVPGRGALEAAADGGYWITGMDEPVAGNVLSLRIGAPAVGHTLRTGDTVLPLSELAPGARARLTLIAD